MSAKAVAADRGLGARLMQMFVLRDHVDACKSHECEILELPVFW